MNIFRNFISTLKHFKMATILNILGLSVAFTAFMIIAMQVWYEYSYDRFHRDVNRIYRVELVDNSSGQAYAYLPRPCAEGVASFSPHIQKMALTGGSGTYALAIEGKEGEFKEDIAYVSPSFPMLFNFNFLVGDSTCLEHPNQIILPESIAKRLFGSVNALGKLIKGRKTVFTVGGIYKDFPLNSLVKNTIYKAIPQTENKDDWVNFNYNCFVLLDHANNKQEVIDHLLANYKTGQEKIPIGKEGETISLRFDLLPSIHFDKTIIYDDLSSKGSKDMLIILSLIGLLIVLIAAINFINFSTALTPLRIKSINTQKVLGASNTQLRVVLILESITISFFSFLIGLVLLKLVFTSPLVSLFHVDMFLSNWKAFVGITLSLALFVGFLAGVYPAFYMTSFSPALVLKGSLGLAKGGDKLRNSLVSIQLITSMVLIIATVFIFLQNEFMQKGNLGFNSKQTVAVTLTKKAYDQRNALEASLKSIAGIQAVTYAENFIASEDNYMTWTRPYKDSTIKFSCIPVDPSFLKVMGISVSQGRDFRDEDALTETGALIFNEAAQHKYNITVDDAKVEGIPVVGIMPDLNFMSMRKSIEPLAFYVWGKQNWGRYPSACYIQLNTPISAAIIQQIRATLKLYDPFPFEFNNYSELIQNNYSQERTLNTLISLFSLIAIFISMVGVFGLVIFESQYRRKEIGIRKVHGAKTSEIIYMFNKTYLKLVGLCFLLAAPIAFYFVKQWLDNFAYKTPIHLWVFAAALIIVSLITCITVTIQSWNTANENPVKSIQ